MLTFGPNKPRMTSMVPSYAMAAQSSQMPLTFGGAAQPVNDPTLQFFSGGGSFGDSYKMQPATAGIVGGIGNFLSNLSFGSTSAAPVYSGRGGDPRQYGAQRRLMDKPIG
jgi:hypothetical protein